MAELTKLKVPAGATAISFGAKVWKSVKGFIEVETEYVEHLLAHADCHLPGEVSAPAPTLESKIEAAKLDFENYIKTREDELAGKFQDFAKEKEEFQAKIAEFEARQLASQPAAAQ